MHTKAGVCLSLSLFSHLSQCQSRRLRPTKFTPQSSIAFAFFRSSSPSFLLFRVHLSPASQPADDSWYCLAPLAGNRERPFLVALRKYAFVECQRALWPIDGVLLNVFIVLANREVITDALMRNGGFTVEMTTRIGARTILTLPLMLSRSTARHVPILPSLCF